MEFFIFIAVVAVSVAFVFWPKPKALEPKFRPARNRRSFSDRTPRDGPLPPIPDSLTLTGRAYVIDGDTIKIGKTKIRLAGIDAPEIDMPWG
ncbi:MAG: hypothetical protein L3J33_11770 [Rhodobacteraceae bacterium]|nr:hypothetical protein [Paracoccaceae bacterium]